MNRAVKRKTALITGGTSGIGLATAKLFLDQGLNVMLVGRSVERGVAALDVLTQPATRADFVRTDVSQTEQCRQAVMATVKKFGGLDILVNSAGIYLERAIEQMTEVDFIEVMDTNIKGTYFMCKYAADFLKQSRSGAIVNVSSDAGVNGNYLCSAYCASKGAVTVFTKALALELAPYKVRVNCICPGDIDTPLTQSQFNDATDHQDQLREMSSLYPLGRIGTAAEAAEVICFLASEKAAFVTGAAWSVDGGLTAY